MARSVPPFICKCGRGFFINPINFVVNNVPKPTVLHFQSQSLTARVENSVAVLTLEQSFLNELESPVEATYQFPTEEAIVVSRVRFELVGTGKTIEAKVQEKEKAKERYEDALA